MTEGAKERICMASLYVGSGEREDRLFEGIASRMRSSPSLKVNCHVDYIRGTRENPGTGRTSVSVLSQLAALNARVSLYHTPALSGWKRSVLPQRYNEVLGLSHFKAFVVDNDVILTG